MGMIALHSVANSALSFGYYLRSVLYSSQAILHLQRLSQFVAASAVLLP